MSSRRAIVAGACALGVTTLFAVLGFSGIPTAMRASGPTIAPPPSSASASAPLGGGADVTVPVKVKRPGSVRSSSAAVLHGTTRTEALAVAATLPVTSSQAPVLPVSRRAAVVHRAVVHRAVVHRDADRGAGQPHAGLVLDRDHHPHRRGRAGQLVGERVLVHR